MNKCLGLLGWIFGHKYVHKDYAAGWTYRSNNCYRCGQPTTSAAKE